jgi:3-oxoacyl-[acyl-carrier protein] reductase
MTSQNFEGKYAIITGAARGILKDAAVVLAERGAAGIIIADLLYDVAVETAKEIESTTKTRALAFKTDVSKPEDIEALFAFAMEKFGAVHILVNGAGVCPTATIQETDAAKWDWVMNINLRSAHLAIREALPIMRKQQYGRIVNIASMSIRIGAIAASAAYAASKGGLAAVSKTYAKQGAKDNITVNAVAPGLILTEMTKNNGYTTNGIPMDRLGLPRDISTVIAFLASDDSCYMTGCTLDVNGGTFMTP